MSLVFIGPPGSGKTKIGRRVARALRTSFLDTDQMVVAEHGPIADIFRTDGEARFREWERAAVVRALGEDGIVALGGGAIMDVDTQRDLEDRRVALITVTAEAVARRITGPKRPLLADGIHSWVSLYEARKNIYERLATRAWDTSNRPISFIARDIAEWAREEQS